MSLSYRHSRVVRHTLFNLVGLGAPLLVAVVAIPLLIRGLGDARFGLLTLIWAVVSYFGLFDLGLGRALTLRMAQLLATEEPDQVGPMVWTALIAMTVLGMVGGLVLCLISGWAVGLIRDVPDVAEARWALYAMAAAIPFIILTSGLRGILEATHEFGVINVIRVPMGVFTFVGPLVVLAFAGPRLDAMAWVLAAGRVIGCVAHWIFAKRAIDAAGAGGITFDSNQLRLLAGSAGWLALSNTISPLMNYVDRFLIGATLSAGAVAFYATPQEMITKLGIVPSALTAVLFPRFSGQIAQRDEAANLTYRRSVVAILIVLLPIVLVLTIWAHPILSLWISAEFATSSAPVLQVLSWGMFATCLATIPFTAIQAAGNARLTGLLHLIEFPVYLVVLLLLVQHLGIIGAAVAWSLRNVVDAVLLFRFADRIMRGLRPIAALA